MELKVKIDSDAVAADIPTMREMPLEGYANYIDGELFFVDHHDVLRAALGEYPIATSSTQVEELIRYLTKVAVRMRASES
ncbi:hypothetical protein E8F20_05795 [Pseudomonas sp. BN415]|uniref:hypothetical protein n=1 Tax=Pseudomonas sp. BN415 TaxID=2567889 RepID=UPI0024574F5B|nr:hypothetical protein [Pseudomonas sp. BN415]MDH4581388.1 hypothetical protein [Pseudomonas sp. BN415]